MPYFRGQRVVGKRVVGECVTLAVTVAAFPRLLTESNSLQYGFQKPADQGWGWGGGSKSSDFREVIVV